MKKSIFLAGSSVRLNGNEECINYIAAQITTKNIVVSLESGIELVFENEKLIEAFDYEDGDKYMRPLLADEKGLTYPTLTPNRIFQLVQNNNGLHQIGGEIPDDFQLPNNNGIIPFQYIGYINDKDPYFDWLPFKIHLACPIYLDVEKVFVNYSIPSKPIIINRKEVELASSAYDEDLDKNSEIVFEEMKVNFVEDLTLSKFGHAGIPIWKQYPKIPSCPQTGKSMRFLCQLNRGTKTKRTNVIPKDDWDKEYYEELNFWGDGSLFVFFEPTSKIACYLIQNT